MSAPFRKPRRYGLGATLLTSALLAGCSSSPPANITLPGAGPATPSAAPSMVSAPSPVVSGNVLTRPLRADLSRPGCRGKNCPAITVDSVVFPGLPRLSAAIDQVLSGMTGVDENLSGGYRSVAGYATYFWRTAQDGDHTWLKARLRGVVGDIISIELDSDQQVAGAAHPIPATRFLLWHRGRDSSVGGLAGILADGGHSRYVAALRSAHTQWLQHNPAYRAHPTDYNKLWPFIESDNVALTEQGLVVKYDAYTIAPYSSGQPEIALPWNEARTFVRPDLLPR